MKKTLSSYLANLLWPMLFLILCCSKALAGNGSSDKPGNPDPGDLAAYVKQKVDFVIKNNLLVSQLDPSELMTLPVGIVTQVKGGKSVVLAIDSARITPQGGFFSAYAAIKLPNTADDDYLAFAAKNVKFKPNGGIDFSNAKLVLVSNRTIRINEKLKLYLPGDGRNAIEWDCNGFKSISLAGQLIFDPSLIKPDPELVPNETEVKVDFLVSGKTGFNFLLEVPTMTPFVIPGLKDFGFTVNGIAVDLSDLENPTDFQYPVDYPSYYGGDGNLWRGFYLRELQIRLPKGLTSDSGRISIAARNVVIDDMGVSGTASASHLLPIGKGSLEGWPFSIDTIGIQILQNRPVGGIMGGSLNIPFLKADSLSYTAQLEQRNGSTVFNFLVQTDKDREYDMAWGGKLRLLAGSNVSVEKINNRYTGRAVLHGSLTVAQPIFKINQLKFQNLDLCTCSPYLLGGTFALTNTTTDTSTQKPSLAKFPISFNNIYVSVNNGTARLTTDISLNLMNSESKGFSAQTSVAIKAKVETTSTFINGEEYKKHKWRYDDLEFNAITLKAKTGALDLDGSLTIFNNDTIYGDGFRGNIRLKFPPLQDYAHANVYFGSKDHTEGNFRYWQANLYVPNLDLPIVPPIVSLTGILGGLSYHMKRQQGNTNATFNTLSGSSLPPTTDTSGLKGIRATPEFDYRPDPNIGLGILLGATMKVKDEKVLKADATLEVLFNTHGGINQIAFKGAAYLFSTQPGQIRNFSSANDVATGSSAPVRAFIDVLYDNPNKVFHASIDTYINVGGFLTGASGRGNGHVGQAVVHVDPRDWYIYIGRPSQMMGLSILGLATVRSYFMLGTKIESMPAPPSQIASILGGSWSAPNYPPGLFTSGNGFGFGAHFATAKEFTMGPFYAGFDIGAGADIMITQFNGEVRCGNDVFRPGINGWYAAGQAYAYLQGGIGIKIRRRRFSIIDVGAAVILQARLPNPTFLKGAVGGRYRLLGGLIRGTVRFSFTIGRDCVPVNGGSEIDNIQVIEAIKPDNSATGVSVFVKPSVTFKTALNTEMPIMDDNGNIRYYKVVLDTQKDFSLVKVATGDTAYASKEFNSSNNVLVYNTNVMLSGNTDYKFRVKVKWLEKIGGNWVNPDNGAEEAEIKEYIFKTGEAPTAVALDNIAYSYPVSRQYNVYKNQVNQGYIQLKTGQPTVFSGYADQGRWDFYARYVGADGQKIDTNISYDNANNRVNFSIPNSLANNKVYNLVIFKRFVSNTQTTDTSGTGNHGGGRVPPPLVIPDENLYVSDQSATLDEMNQGFQMVNQSEMDSINKYNYVKPPPIQAPVNPQGSGGGSTVVNSVETPTDFILYRVSFRTSLFNTIEAKLNALTNEQNVLNVVSGNVTAIAKRYSSTEGFDEMELFGKGNNDVPLIQLSATPNNDWYNQYMRPLLYELYGADPNLTIGWRNLNDLSNPAISYPAPMKAVKLHNNLNFNGYTLSDDDVRLGTAPARADDIMFAYYLSYYCVRDYQDLRNKAASLYLADESSINLPPVAQRLLFAKGYTDLLPGQYELKANYMLPGPGAGTTNFTKTLNLLFRTNNP
jgi:hypothetical protein